MVREMMTSIAFSAPIVEGKARLRERHPSMRIETRRSMFDQRGCIR